MSKQKKKILWVDDNADLLESMGDLADIIGFTHEFAFFTDPREALTAISQRGEEFAFVLSDFQMPPMNGAELITTIKKIHPNLHCILLSAALTEIPTGHQADNCWEKKIMENPTVFFAQLETEFQTN
jgi:DNA-binding NtrC family response regulator